MKAVLFLLVILFNTACVSAFIPRERPPHNPRFAFDWSEEMSKNSKEQFAKWDKTHISDDVVLVEIYDKNGKLVGTAKGR